MRGQKSDRTFSPPRIEQGGGLGQVAAGRVFADAQFGGDFLKAQPTRAKAQDLAVAVGQQVQPVLLHVGLIIDWLRDRLQGFVPNSASTDPLLELADYVRLCLRTADEHGLTLVGIHLNEALCALADLEGTGAIKPEPFAGLE